MSTKPKSIENWDCSLATLDIYKAHLDEIFDAFITLRGDSPTIIRAFSFYVPMIDCWGQYDIQEACTECFENLDLIVRQSAKEHNIPVVGVYEAFNGLNHDESPIEKGYIGSDGIHTNDMGKAVMADALRALGYEFTIP